MFWFMIDKVKDIQGLDVLVFIGILNYIASKITDSVRKKNEYRNK